MFACAPYAIVSPAIFLAFADPGIKQAHIDLLRIQMIPPFASKDEIDPAVIRRVAEGDSVAFERVYDAFSGILYSLALRMLDRPEDTEELLQEVFAKIWRDAADYDPRRGAPLAWAITITRHKAIDRIRSTARRLRLYEAAESGSQGQPALGSPARPGRRAVGECEGCPRVSGTLPPEVRESIELAFFGGLSHSPDRRKAFRSPHDGQEPHTSRHDAATTNLETIRMSSEEREELAALYALGMLEGSELAAFERELVAHPELAALVAEFEQASTLLATSVPQHPAPDSLRHVRFEPNQGSPAGGRAHSSIPRADSSIPVLLPLVAMGDRRGIGRLLCFALERKIQALCGNRKPGERESISLGPDRWSGCRARPPRNTH